MTEEWTKQFIPIQHKVEEGVSIIRTGKAVKKPMTVPDSKHLDEKLKKAFSLNSKKRPTGTAKDGNYRTFSTMNRTASMAMVGSENGMSSPASPTIGSRTMSMSSNSSKFANFSETLPRYSAIAVPAAGTPLNSSNESLKSGTEKVEQKEEAQAKEAAKEEETVGATGEDESGKYEIMTAQYTFVAVQDTDLSFNVGDRIKVFKRDDDDWWEGETMDGRRGEFPGNYVK